MDNNKFEKLCKNIVIDYYNKNADKVAVTGEIAEKDVSIVWVSKVLQNNKALVITTPPDGTYYEITHNGDRNEVYVDVYNKRDNFCISI